jgi:hypothetical protein
MTDIEMSKGVVLTSPVGPHPPETRGVVVDVLDDGEAFEVQLDNEPRVAPVERKALAPKVEEGDEVELTTDVAGRAAGTRGIALQVAVNLLEVEVSKSARGPYAAAAGGPTGAVRAQASL